MEERACSHSSNCWTHSNGLLTPISWVWRTCRFESGHVTVCNQYCTVLVVLTANELYIAVTEVGNRHPVFGVSSHYSPLTCLLNCHSNSKQEEFHYPEPYKFCIARSWFPVCVVGSYPSCSLLFRLRLSVRLSSSWFLLHVRPVWAT